MSANQNALLTRGRSGTIGNVLCTSWVLERIWSSLQRGTYMKYKKPNRVGGNEKPPGEQLSISPSFLRVSTTEAPDSVLQNNLYILEWEYTLYICTYIYIYIYMYLFFFLRAQWISPQDISILYKILKNSFNNLQGFRSGYLCKSDALPTRGRRDSLMLGWSAGCLNPWPR